MESIPDSVPWALNGEFGCILKCLALSEIPVLLSGSLLHVPVIGGTCRSPLFCFPYDLFSLHAFVSALGNL